MLSEAEQVGALLDRTLSQGATRDVVTRLYHAAHALESYLAMRSDARSAEDSIVASRLVSSAYTALGLITEVEAAQNKVGKRTTNMGAG